MKLIKQIIQKKLELYEEFKLKRYYKRSIWNFFCSLNLSLSFLKRNLSVEDNNKINLLYRKILLTPTINENQFKLIEKIVNQYTIHIIDCLEILDNVQNEKYQMGDIYVEGMIGVSSYEFEI